MSTELIAELDDITERIDEYLFYWEEMREYEIKIIDDIIDLSRRHIDHKDDIDLIEEFSNSHEAVRTRDNISDLRYKLKNKS